MELMHDAGVRRRRKISADLAIDLDGGGRTV
jgi:hypothetical protein